MSIELFEGRSAVVGKVKWDCDWTRTSISISFFWEQFFDFLRKMTLGTPDQTDECHHHEHGDESQPEWLLQHTLGQWFVWDVEHAFFATCALPPGVTSGRRRIFANDHTRIFHTNRKVEIMEKHIDNVWMDGWALISLCKCKLTSSQQTHVPLKLNTTASWRRERVFTLHTPHIFLDVKNALFDVLTRTALSGGQRTIIPISYRPHGERTMEYSFTIEQYQQ